jgi:predicted TIM-barrel fold metal-dependent hydrolase
MTGENVVIVSADCHAGAPLHGYRDYLASRWHEDFDAWAQAYQNPFSDLDEIYADRNWDSAKRLRHLEEDGIAAELIFPNTVPPFYPANGIVAGPPSAEEYERRWAGLQAHNRWLADFCADAPGQRAGIAQLLFNRVEDAVAEIRWARGHGLTGGVLMPAIPPGSGIPPLWDLSYEPIWQTCEDLGIPINHHGGSGTPDYGYGPGMPRLMYLQEFAFFSHRVLWQVVWGGVFERHPNLRYVVTEQGFGEVLNERLTHDGLYAMLNGYGDEQQYVAAREMVGDYVKTLSLRPSEYLQRNVWFGASFMSSADAARRDEAGVQRVMWGADYPHTEGTWPKSRASIAAALTGVSEAEGRQLLGLNAVDLYGFDLPVLQGVADRIGPRPEEIFTSA